MRLSLPLRWVAPHPNPVRPTITQVYGYLNQHVDLKLQLDEQVESITFLIKTYKNDRSVKPMKLNRFVSPRQINPRRPFPLNQLAYQNPNVQFDFQDRESKHPDRVEDGEMTEEEALLLKAGRGVNPAETEQLRSEAETLVNQEEFVDVYFLDNPTPLRLNITLLNPTETVSLLTSILPPPSTSTTTLSSEPNSSNIATTSPSEPPVSIPLGQGKELWEHVWKTRNLDSDKSLYFWRDGQRYMHRSRDELVQMGVNVPGPGMLQAKRKWTNGVFTLGSKKEVVHEEGEASATTTA